MIAASDAKDRLSADAGLGRPRRWARGTRLGDHPGETPLLTGDCITGRRPPSGDWLPRPRAPEDLDERTERLVERIAAMPVNQLIMASSRSTPRCTNRAATSRMVSTVFDGIARHTPEGHAFVADAREHGFRGRSSKPRRTLWRIASDAAEAELPPTSAAAEFASDVGGGRKTSDVGGGRKTSGV